MNPKIVCLTVPGLRSQDVEQMPRLQALVSGGDRGRIQHSFPAVTWPSQASLLTGQLPEQHGVIANGFYWRDQQKVEMWTAWNEVIEAPQIWDLLKQKDPALVTAAWFPMLSKGCGADHVCMPAPIHKPDGSEDLWCYTKPQEYYGALLEQLGHFPLQHFWGPMANIKSSQWIADSAAKMFADQKPDFSYIYLPHLDYAAQKIGPDSEAANQAVAELDELIGNFASQLQQSHQEICWMIASEYVITETDHVTYPNRILREAGLLVVNETDQGELLDLDKSRAWALVDHQFSHVFVRDANEDVVAEVVGLFRDLAGIDRVLALGERTELGMNHGRSGEVIVASTPNSWQAYYYWQDDAQAPEFARTVDIHRKPGYDPVELHFDMATKSIPLDATLVRGSHGAPVESDEQRGVFLCSKSGVLEDDVVVDRQICDLVLRQFS